MQVFEAIDYRQSVRAYLKRSVPCDQIAGLLHRAGQAPSGGNLQPWQVHVIKGQPKADLTARVLQKLDQNQRETAHQAVYPSALWEPLRSRRRDAGCLRYTALGQTRDEASALDLERANYRFFGAPVGIFITLDRRCGPPQWADAGLFLQSLMLLAVEQGLSTCPQAVWAQWPQTVAEGIGYGPDQVLYTGLSLGYADWSSPLNHYRTGRANLDEFARFIGFET